MPSTVLLCLPQLCYAFYGFVIPPAIKDNSL